MLSVLVVEQAPQMVTTHAYVPMVSSAQVAATFPGDSPRQQVHLTQAPSKWLLSPWLPEHMRFCVHF